MAMVGVVSGSLYRRTHSLSRLAWSWVGGLLGAVLHSSNHQSELVGDVAVPVSARQAVLF